MHVLLISNCHFHTELNFKLSSRGSSSSLSESSSRSGDPQGSDGPASRVVTWAVCFERLLEDHVGVRYFTVRFNADFYEANVGITLIFLVIFQHENLSEWSSLTLLDYPDIFFYFLLLNIKYYHQAFEELLFVHLSIIIVWHHIMFWSSN